MNLERKKIKAIKKQGKKTNEKLETIICGGSQNTNPNLVNIQFKRESLSLSDSTMSDFYKREIG